jgi:EAL domain-containing protein (putative c-di-GMP-specific phosphodiesterase class I)
MLIDTLIQPGNITTVFQPIVALAGGGTQLHSVECLSRGRPGSHFESAEVMFEYVRCMAAEPRMDLRCIETALDTAKALPKGMRLSLNAHTATLSRMATFPIELEALLRKRKIPPNQLTLEITEHAVPWISSTFHEAIEYLRGLGVRIALDDVGAGHANFKMLLDVRPDVLKVDRYLIQGIASDAWRQAIVDAMVRFGRSFEIDVVAEGISSESDLAALRALDVPFAQGFLFARPMPAPELLAHPLITGAAREDCA